MTDFPALEDAILLCDAFLSSPELSVGCPSGDMIMWIERIKAANPDLHPSDDEDNNFGQWGHLQFTCGNLTTASVLTSWASVGDVRTACRLLSATFKTCQEA